ncbi:MULTISPECIES: TetR/AcrR family transcriptional regulator [Gordonia]|uniref:Putative TetR family transcriptional regulator n=1 Tax=Gordonia sputi NBRC 100414 TaxID=1089453 RepID=H5U6K2_9ACTN|nr:MULTISPECIES: TetR/AcrR family transcriptional regulator C-terminal domain-containing protein [Gordonia]NKY94778.1 TetR/AcrR family transcriptional regulator [Gordonia sputi]OBA40982.1 TetR family transcriptional regulator [Gordonia sp. 852002-51296_SCH5728562-b]OBA61899.1 TetR family transcriptional regulator [Gordonia sp. 852002-10350_SCH5691597]GAB41360.1 putative TetR family transcriptional regulator [Gordonia sputi NBRC 100414]
MPRPRTPILDPNTIARAALDALDADGSFTMPGVAKRLNVAVSSLYHHVASREQLLELIRGVIAEELSVSIEWPEDWREVVREWLIGYRAGFGAHPELVRALTAQTVRAPEVLRGYDRLAQKLVDAGFPIDRVLHVITFLDTIALGSALDVGAPEEVWSADGVAADSTLGRALSAAPTGRVRADEAFELTVDLAVIGLETELARVSQN